MTAKTTNKEREFFQEFLDNEANRAELLEEIPSFRMDADGNVSIAKDDVDNFVKFIDGSIVADGARSVPPRLRSGRFVDLLEDDLVKGDLAPDEAARQARAADQGFTDDVFHGTHATDVEALEISDLGVHVGTSEAANVRLTDKQAGRLGVSNFATRNKDFGEGGNVLPLKANIGKSLRLDDAGEWRDPSSVITSLRGSELTSGKPALNEKLVDMQQEADEIHESFAFGDEGSEGFFTSPEAIAMIDELREMIQDAGFDSVVYKNFVEARGGSSDSFIILKSENLRSQFAQFDPAKKGSNVLLASGAAAAGGATLVGQADDAEASGEFQVASAAGEAAEAAARVFRRVKKILRPDARPDVLSDAEFENLRRIAENPVEASERISDLDLNGMGETADIDRLFDALSTTFKEGDIAERGGRLVGKARVIAYKNAAKIRNAIDDLGHEQGMNPAEKQVLLIQLRAKLNDIEARLSAARRKTEGHPTRVSNEDTAWLAEVTGITPEKLINRQTGEAYNAAELLAAKTIVNGMLKRLRKLHAKTKLDPTPENIVELRRATIVTGATLLKFKGAVAEAGRALQVLRPNAVTPLARASETNDLLQISGGAEVGQKFVDMVGDILQNGDDIELSQFTIRQRKATTSDMLVEAWINSLLGNPATHVVNFSTNAVMQLLLTADRYGAYAAGAIERGITGSTRGVHFEDANSFALGQMQGIIEGIFVMFRSIKTGHGSDVFSKVAPELNASITSANINELRIAKAMSPELLKQGGVVARVVDFVAANYYRGPGKLLGAADDLFKTIAYRGQVNEYATRQVREEGLTGEAARRRFEQIVTEPEIWAPQIHIDSLDVARFATLTQPPGEFGQALNRLRFAADEVTGGLPIARQIVPFLQVINNITKYPFLHTPFAAIGSPRTRAALMSPDPAVRQRVLGQWAVGVGLLALGGQMASSGYITGEMTENPKLLKTLNDEGKTGYSAFLPWVGKFGRSFSYKRTAPVGTFFAVAADTQKMLAHTRDPRERQMIVFTALAAIVPFISDQTFTSGIKEFMDAMDPRFGGEGGRSKALARFAARQLSSLPGAVLGPLAPGTPLSGAIARKLDNVRRDARPDMRETAEYRIWQRLRNTIFKRTPGLSSTLAPEMNVWGETQIYEGSLGPDMKSQIYTRDLTYDYKALGKIKGFPRRASIAHDFVGLQVGADITREQLREFINIVGINGELERLGMPISNVSEQIEGVRLNVQNNEVASYRYLRGAGVTMKGDGSGLLIVDFDGTAIDLGPVPSGWGRPIMPGLKVNKRYNLKEFLDAYVRTEQYQSLGDDPTNPGEQGPDTKAEIIKSIVSKFGKIARSAMKVRYTELNREIWAL